MFDFDFQHMLKIAVPILAGLTVHECAHGWVAMKLGDPTAQREGRITLNPLPHLDLVGTLMIFFSGLFGWAKPVPVDARNFKNPVRDMSLTALAGPVANILLATFFGLLLRLFIYSGLHKSFSPLMAQNIVDVLFYGVLINIGLAVFNLLPVPPLDGFRVVSYFLPARWIAFGLQYSLIWLLLLMILMYTGVLGRIVGPLIVTLQRLIL